MTFGTVLREVRQRNNLSQGKLAQRCGISYSYVSRLESDERNITKGMLNKLADCAGFSPDDIRGLKVTAGFYTSEIDPRFFFVLLAIQRTLLDLQNPAPAIAALSAVCRAFDALAQAPLGMKSIIRNPLKE